MSKEDFNALRLRHHGDARMMHEILQRECRYKCRYKLSETLACPDFIFPSLSVAEMATSDAVADIHADFISPGSKVLDMTCGLGIDAFRFAAKGACVTALELDRATFDAACHNAEALGLSDVRLIYGDSVEWLENSDEVFDTIFIDPARRDSSGRHFDLKDCHPDIIGHLDLLLDRCSQLIIKASPMLDISATLRQLQTVEKVTVIGTVRECKELVFICKGRRVSSSCIPVPSLIVDCITVGGHSFSFSIDDERNYRREVSVDPLLHGGIIYEPYPAVMKAMGFASLSRRFAPKLLHPNTNLFYTPPSVDATDFPGERFKIIDVLPFNKETVRHFSANHPKVNVAVRNFPLSAPELVKKLKIKEGGSEMLFGTTVAPSQKLLLLTERF